MTKAKIDEVTSVSQGMPDSWHIDESGKAAMEVYVKRFGLGRKYRHAKLVLDSMIYRANRLNRFVKALLHYRHLQTPILTTGDGKASPEAIVLATYDLGWHLRTEDELTECAKIAPEVLSARLKDMLAQNNKKELNGMDGILKQMALASDTTPERVFEVMGKCALETWFRAKNELSNWTALTMERRHLLSDALFTGFTIFGKDALEEISEIQPAVLEYYRTFLKAPKTPLEVAQPATTVKAVQPATHKKQMPVTELPPSARNENSPDDSFDVSQPYPATPIISVAFQGIDNQIYEAPPASLQELYGLIARLGAAAHSAPSPGIKPGMQIRTLLDEHLEQLYELQSMLSEDAVQDLVERYCDAVLQIVETLRFGDSELCDLVPVLKAAWRITVLSALESGESREWFDSKLADHEHRHEEEEKYLVEQARIALAKHDLEEILEQLDTAKFTARTVLRAKKTQKESAISSAQQELDAIRMSVAERLVPDGQSIDELMDNSDAAQVHPVIDLNKLNHRSILALQSVVQSFDVPVASSSVQTVDSEQLSAENTLSVIPAASQAHEEPAPLAPTPQTDSSKPIVIASVTSNRPDDDRPEKTIEPDATDSDAESDMATGTAIPTLQERLIQFDWGRSEEAARTAFLAAKDEYQQVPAVLIDAIAQHWMSHGHLNAAFYVTKEANASTLVGEQVLAPALVRAAYFGMHFRPRDSEALTDIQRTLNLLSHAEIDEQLSRRPTGKLVPYLLACATFLPALFTGSETQAPTLLRVAAPYFDDHIRQLFMQTADFSMRGGRVDLDTLKNEKAIETRNTANKIKDDVDAWLHRNLNRSTGWAPTISALRLALKRPVIERAIKALQAGEQGDIADVRAFIGAYSEMASKRYLLDDLLAQLRTETQFSDHADGSAYTTFCQQIQALESCAVKWLMEVAPTEILAKDVQGFLQKFHTLLKESVNALNSHGDYTELEHKAGETLLLKLLNTLQTTIQQNSNETPNFGQTEATFHLPDALSRITLGDVGPDLRLEWLTNSITTENWLMAMEVVAAKASAHWIRLLLLRQLEEAGDRRDDAINVVISDITTERKALKQTIEQYRNLSLQAQLNDVIPEADHHGNIGRSDDWLEALSARKVYLGISDITHTAQVALRLMERALSSKAVDVAAELDQELGIIRDKLGVDAVPDVWESRARQALERRSLSLVTELINQLREHRDSNSRVEATTLLENVELNRFQQVQTVLHSLLTNHPNPREAADLIIDKQPGGLDVTSDKSAFRAVMATLLEWRSKGKNKRPQLEKETYEGITAALEFVGFDVKTKEGKADVLRNCEYSSIGEARRLSVRINRPSLPKGFPLFEGDIGTETSLNVIFVQGYWVQETLHEMVERDGFPGKSVLIVGHPLSSEERGKLRTYCRKHAYAIFLLDPVALAFIATFNNYKRLESFLRISAAWTYFNPYTLRDARIYAPPEMRFGREKDTEKLIAPRGAALVYGGRQLGKTTLLHSAVQAFKKQNPGRNHAFWMDLNNKYQHAVERNVPVKDWLFADMAEKLEDSGIIQKNHQLSAEERVRREFLKEGATRVLFCLDEIDDVLNKDAASNFALIGSLKALVNDPHNRFRVVLAGLNNVNRFRTFPNVPLQQLGSPLQVKVLDSRDARALILQPLSALGYQFETPELVDRIMAFTNHHPSLLHIFCGELVEYLAHDNRSSDPYLIRLADLESIESNQDVRKLSADRLDMTLNLDKRYTVVIYGLLDDDMQEGNRAFSVTKALSIARIWVPEEFASMTEASFENLLMELVGLGVLQPKENHHYVLRNQSILHLLGSRETIAHQLQIGINDLKNRKEDVLTCHASRNDPLPFLSALTLRDEQTIIEAKTADEAKKYSVSVVMGSEALGLTVNAVKESFGAINDSDEQHNTVRFDKRVLDGIVLYDLKRFSDAIASAITQWASSAPVIAIVPLLGDHSIASAMDMISIANESAGKATQLKHPLRIVFLLGPRLMWEWFAHSSITSLPDEIGGQVILDRWTRHACENLLAQQGMTATYEQGEKLRSATEGWYGSTMKFIAARKRKMSATNLDDLSTIFGPLTEVSSAQFEKFVKGCGVTEQSWSLPLAATLTDSKFSRDDVEVSIELLLDEHPEFDLSPDMASTVVRWWSSLRVLDVNSRNDDQPEKITYRFTPAVQRLLNEYLKRAA